jgi:UPF0755 protein
LRLPPQYVWAEVVGDMPLNRNGNDVPGKDEESSRAEQQPTGRFAGQRMTPRSPKEALQPDTPPPPPIPPSYRHPALSAMSGFLSFLLAIAIASVAGLIWSQHRLHEPGPLDTNKVVYIAPGTEVPDIIAALERDNVIDSPFLLNATLLVEGNRSKVRAGEYLFKKNASLRDVIDTLVTGKQVLHAITVPEGLTSEQIVERLKETDILIGDIIDVPKEGSLLPETYKFSRGTLRAEVIRKMQDDQRRTVDQIWARRAANLPLRSPYELITLASLVEKETGKADERPRVASVFLNRLRKGMRLQSDPTIVYGLAGGKGTLGRGITASELEKPTPYNTYLIDGLPPGPIANPGRAALEAVANPSRTQDLYFVADGTGGHVFAETLEQHNRNVQRWHQIEKDLKDKLDPQAPNLGETAPPKGPQASPPSAQPAGGRKSERSNPSSVYGALPASVGDLENEARKAPAPSAISAAAAIAPAISANASDPNALRNNDKAKSAAKITAYAFGPRLEDLGISLDGVRGAAAALDGPVGTDDEQKASAKGGKFPVAFGQPGENRTEVPPTAGSPTANRLLGDSVKPDNGIRPMPREAEGAEHGRAFDASQGTPRDPLKNKTYDLNYAKTVPDLQ